MNIDPATMTDDQRLHALARIFANGLIRYRQQQRRQELRQPAEVCLAVAPDPRLSGRASVNGLETPERDNACD